MKKIFLLVFMTLLCVGFVAAQQTVFDPCGAPGAGGYCKSSCTGSGLIGIPGTCSSGVCCGPIPPPTGGSSVTFIGETDTGDDLYTLNSNFDSGFEAFPFEAQTPSAETPLIVSHEIIQQTESVLQYTLIAFQLDVLAENTDTVSFPGSQITQVDFHVEAGEIAALQVHVQNLGGWTLGPGDPLSLDSLVVPTVIDVTLPAAAAEGESFFTSLVTAASSSGGSDIPEFSTAGIVITLIAVLAVTLVLMKKKK
jgi:hypothetical protein